MRPYNLIPSFYADFSFNHLLVYVLDVQLESSLAIENVDRRIGRHRDLNRMGNSPVLWAFIKLTELFIISFSSFQGVIILLLMRF